MTIEAWCVIPEAYCFEGLNPRSSFDLIEPEGPAQSPPSRVRTPVLGCMLQGHVKN